MKVINFCTEPDKNGNFLLLDIDVEKNEYQYGYHFRYANRADDVVLSRKQMVKLVDKLESAGFKRTNRYEEPASAGTETGLS